MDSPKKKKRRKHAAFLDSIDDDDTPPRQFGSRKKRTANRVARSDNVIVIDSSEEDDDDDTNGDRKPAAKHVSSAEQWQRHQQKQSRYISLLDDGNSSNEDSSIEEIQPNNKVAQGRKRSRPQNLSTMMYDCDLDRALAKKLQKQEEANAHNVAKANPIREQRLMAQSTDGKSVLAVQEIMSLVTETRAKKKYKHDPNLVDYIAPVTREDMFYFCKEMLMLQEEFLKKSINGYIDVGYHYTSSAHMANIRQHGLLTKRDRESQQVNSRTSGSVFGDGVYTANNADNFSSYGNTGVLVARLTGKMVRVARSLLPNTKVDANTIIGDKIMIAASTHRQGQSLDKDGWPLKDDFHEIVLRSSAQCLPMISFDSRARQSKEGKKCIKNLEKGLQAIFDKLFNKGMKRSEYTDSELLNAQTTSNYPLPAFNGPAFLSAMLPPGIPAPQFPGMGPSIASNTIARRSATTTHSSYSMARQRMRGNNPLYGGNAPIATGGSKRLPRNAIPTAMSSSAAMLSSSNTLTYKAPSTLTTGIPSDAMSKPDSSYDMEEDCVICQDPLDKRRKCAKLKCGHIFHKKCIQRAFQSKPECPVCRKSIGAPIGKCPSGTMTTTTSSMRCSGFREGSIVITYVIPAGRQMSYHDNPGTSHASKHVTAYIPK